MEGCCVRKNNRSRKATGKKKEECHIFHSVAELEQRTIGVTGISEGMGVTHLVIALANYSVSFRRRKTAIVELSGNHTIEKLTGTSGPGAWKGITCYPNLEKSRIADVINGDYEVVIFDMGSSYYRIRTELLRCSRKLVLGSLAPWRKKDYYEFALEEMGEDRYARGMGFFAKNGIKKDKKEFHRLVGQPVYPLPFLPEPFQVTKDQYGFFEGFLP